MTSRAAQYCLAGRIPLATGWKALPYMLQENAKWQSYGHLNDSKSVLKNSTK